MADSNDPTQKLRQMVDAAQTRNAGRTGHTGKQLEEATSLANAKIDNLLQLVVGHQPKDDVERYSAVNTLQDVLGVDFHNALQQYVKYQNDNFFTKRAKDLAMKATVAIHKDGYLQQVNDRINTSIKQAGPDYMNDPENYGAKVTLGLQKLLSQPSVGNQLASHFMDFRNLDQPIPVTTSNITYPPADATQQ